MDRDPTAVRYDVLGVRVTPMRAEELLQTIGHGVASNTRTLIGQHNLHGVYLSHRDLKMQEFYDLADFVYIDGMPLVWIGRFLGFPLRRHHRVTFIDVVYLLMSEATKQRWRVFCIGSKPGVAERAAEILRFLYPRLQIATSHGYLDTAAKRCVIERIREFKPDVVIVGMGSPTQEHWVVDHLEMIDAGVVLGNMGAIFDQVAGVQPTSPRWMGRLGLEGLYRLARNPRRLWKRYLIEPWLAVWLAILAKRGRG